MSDKISDKIQAKKTSDKTSDLLPCPFCGGEAVLHVNDGIRVICRNCGATSKRLMDGYSQGKPNGTAWKSVVTAWNTRKPMERIVERLEFQAEESRDYWNNFDDEYAFGAMNAYTNAIEIVKEELDAK